MNPVNLNITPKYPEQWVSYYNELNELIPKINQAERIDQLEPEVLRQAQERCELDPMFYIYFTAHFNLQRTFKPIPVREKGFDDGDCFTYLELLELLTIVDEGHPVAELHFITHPSETRFTIHIGEATTSDEIRDFILGIKEEIEIIEEVFKDHPNAIYHSYHKVPDKDLYEAFIHFKDGVVL